MDRDTQKRRAAERAVDRIEDGDVVGLGSGSTAAAAIRALAGRVDAGLDVRGVPTSHQARDVALDAGVPVVDLDQVDGVDVAVDGADQVALGSDREPVGDTVEDADGPWTAPALIKGGGGAHAREKLVDAAADQFLVVVDPTKCTTELDAPVPVEVLPAARTVVAEAVRDLGGDPTLRAASAKSGPVVTDNGNLVLDCAFGTIEKPADLATALSSLPGVLEHGLFVDLADAVYVGTEAGVEEYGG